MPCYTRYAIYYTPDAGNELARLGAAWLGWDTQAGTPCPHPDLPGLPVPIPDITQTPRKYGLHGTLKPPFSLAPGHTFEALTSALETFCAARAPVGLDGLDVTRLGGFLALTPRGDTTDLAALAASIVETFEPFRAALTDAQMDKRRKGGLTERQDALLMRWGYPYVMDEFRFHLTLSGKLTNEQADQIAPILAEYLRPALPVPFPITGLSLCGEDAEGRFHVLHRHALAG